MRNLKYAILGLLNQNSMTGYELMKQFESKLCEFWNARHSQIYPELKRLTDENCITYDIQISGVSLEKKQYTITQKGKEDFLSWLSAETPLAPIPKEVSRLKIFFCNSLSAEDRKQLFEEQLLQHQLRLQHLKENQKKFSTVPASDTPEFGDYLLLKGGIMREEMYCDWLRECLALL